jgi:hypothetical protein
MIDKTLGHYQVTCQLRKGGMGDGYQAKDQKFGRDVAIKVLPEEFTQGSIWVSIASSDEPWREPVWGRCPKFIPKRFNVC